MPYLLSSARNRKIGGNMSDRLTKDDRSRLLQGAMESYLRRRSGLGSFTGSQGSQTFVVGEVRRSRFAEFNAARRRMGRFASLLVI